MAEGATGTVTQVMGAVVDVEFPSGEMPEIHNALQAQAGGGDGGEPLVLEVQHDFCNGNIHRRKQ